MSGPCPAWEIVVRLGCTGGRVLTGDELEGKQHVGRRRQAYTHQQLCLRTSLAET